MAALIYPFLVRDAGRGRPRAHLADGRGEALCGRAFGERWSPARSTRRPVCRQSLAAREQQHKEISMIAQTQDCRRPGGHHIAGPSPSERILFAIWNTIDRVRDRQGEHVAHQLALRAMAAITSPEVEQAERPRGADQSARA